MANKIVVVDIDGTISKVGDRLKYLKETPVDWDSFYEACFDDEPIKEVCDLLEALEPFYEIVFCTGRRESVRTKTVEWILKHVPSNVHLFDDELVNECLVMRPDGDKRHDIEVKPEQLKLKGFKIEDIAFVLEDRNSMVAKWRDLGVKCLQVADGDF